MSYIWFLLIKQTQNQKQTKKNPISQKLSLPKVSVNFSSNIQNVNLLRIIYSSKTRDTHLTLGSCLNIDYQEEHMNKAAE